MVRAKGEAGDLFGWLAAPILFRIRDLEFFLFIMAFLTLINLLLLIPPHTEILLCSLKKNEKYIWQQNKLF